MGYWKTLALSLLALPMIAVGVLLFVFFAALMLMIPISAALGLLTLSEKPDGKWEMKVAGWPNE